MVASLTCTPQLTLPYTMSLWVPNLPYYDSRPHGPCRWRNRSRKEWGWLQREQAEWSVGHLDLSHSQDENFLV